jgi:hypothetical protein
METLKKFIKHPLTLRILNCNAIFLLIIAIVLRLALFAPTSVTTESKDDSGVITLQTQPVKVKFWFVITTLFILPPLIVLLILMEFKVRQDILGVYFNFLCEPVGRGIYLIMIALMIVEVEQVTEMIFCIIISIVGITNISIGCVYIKMNYSLQEASWQVSEENCI